MLRGQIGQVQLHHAQEVVARQPVLVKHLEDHLVLGRTDTEHKLLVPLGIQRLLLRLGQHRVNVHIARDCVEVDAHVRVTEGGVRKCYWSAKECIDE